MTAGCDTMHLLLQAELDGELGASGAAGLADHLEACRECAALRTDLATLSTQLRGGLTRYSAPLALQRKVRAPQNALSRRSTLSHAAAFGAGLAIAASLMFMVRPGANAGDLTDLVTAHVRALQPGHLLDVPSSDRHTVKPWFDGRVAFSPNVPDLADQGFPLVGGRLDYLGGHAIAALVYTRRQHVIDVFVTPGTRPESTATLQGYNTVGWVGDGLVYQAVSDLNPAELATFVGLMQAPHS